MFDATFLTKHPASKWCVDRQCEPYLSAGKGWAVNRGYGGGPHVRIRQG